MIIILIVITIAVKHQQEQERLAQFEEVSVLLSRDIATSVVMNDLPSSAPAMLHDYENSPLDRIKDFRIMPIIELHKGFVRDHFSGARYSREELLQQNNAFDRLLQSMNASQRRRIRIDVYDISMFYIAMSIIRAHGQLPSHWHFLGETKSAPGDEAEESQSEQKDEQSDMSEDMLREPGEGDPTSDSDAWEQVWQSFPKGAELSAEHNEQAYPFDDLAYDTEMSQDNDGVDIGQLSESQLSDKMFDTLSKMLSDSTSKQGQEGLPNMVRFRTARTSDGKSDSEKNEEILQFKREQEGSGLVVKYIYLIVSLFRYMQQADQAAQNGNYAVLEKFDFQRDIVVPALTIKMPTDPKKGQFYLNLVKKLAAISGEPTALHVTQQSGENDKNALKIPLNTPLKKALFITAPQQEQRDFLPGEAKVQLNLGLYPAIYKGLAAPLNGANMILMPRDTTNPQQNRWRIATIITPKKGDYLLAFIYGRISADEQLIIASDENAVKLEQFHTYTFHPPVLFRKEKESFLIFGTVALLLFAGMMRRFRRTAQ